MADKGTADTDPRSLHPKVSWGERGGGGINKGGWRGEGVKQEKGKKGEGEEEEYCNGRRRRRGRGNEGEEGGEGGRR